ncbi:MAG: hypothetical protein CSA62_11760 [Planctomycetota bacterium]|nr:MAG: hypothetical protein CSA62_11760 [Planctomycetota bacterium]
MRFFRLFSLPLFAGLLMSASDSAQPDAEAIAAYARGEAELAGRLWEQAAEKLGEHAPVRVQLNAASAALQRGAVKRAHELTLAARAKATGQEQARVDFLLAQVGYERARFAQRILSGPEAGPADVDRALGFASVAVEFWQRAAVAETSWGPARRNAERALRLLRALEIKQQEILGEVKLLSTPQARLRKPSAPKPGAPSPKPGKGKEQVLKTQPKSVAAVLQRLREREAERRARVEAARKRRGRGVRDW